jgi:hypothetical protein
VTDPSSSSSATQGHSERRSEHPCSRNRHLSLATGATGPAVYPGGVASDFLATNGSSGNRDVRCNELLKSRAAGPTRVSRSGACNTPSPPGADAAGDPRDDRRAPPAQLALQRLQLVPHQLQHLQLAVHAQRYLPPQQQQGQSLEHRRVPLPRLVRLAMDEADRLESKQAIIMISTKSGTQKCMHQTRAPHTHTGT